MKALLILLLVAIVSHEVLGRVQQPILPCVQLVPSRAGATSFGVIHTCGPRRRLLLWGNNEDGQLGRDDRVEPFSAMSNPGGGNSSSDDSEKEATSKSAFKWVQGLDDAEVVSACVGDHHTCVLYVQSENATAGEVKCFGSNEFGQLGQGSTKDYGGSKGSMESLEPIDVGGSVVALACGGSTTCVLLQDSRRVKCFGVNDKGQAGIDDNATEAIGTSPDQMGENLKEVLLNISYVAFGIGTSSVCAAGDDNHVYCWGDNVFGELGQGNNETIGAMNGSMEFLRENPVDLGLNYATSTPTTGPSQAGNVTFAPSIEGNVTFAPSIADGNATSAPSVAEGNVTSAPSIAEGNATIVPTVSPSATLRRLRRRVLQSDNGTQDDGETYTLDSVHVGGYYACAVVASSSNQTKSVKCWGFGGHGVLGSEANTNVGDTPESMGTNLSFVNYGNRSVEGFVAGHSHACVRFENFTAACYGAGAHGQLGVDSDEDVGSLPGSMGESLKEIELNGSIWDLAAGANTTVVIAGDYFQVYAFGTNDHRQLGRDGVDTYGGEEGDMASILPIDLGICTSVNFLHLGEDIRLIPSQVTQPPAGNFTFAPSVMDNSTTHAPSISDNSTTTAPSVFGDNSTTTAPSISGDNSTTHAPSIAGDSTEAPSISRRRRLQATLAPTTTAPTIFGQETTAPSVPGAETVAPSIVATEVPTIVDENVTSAPSVDGGNVTTAPSIAGNATTAPSIAGNETEGNETMAPTLPPSPPTLENPYYIHNPLNATTVVVYVSGPGFVRSKDFEKEIEIEPGETKWFDIAFADNTTSSNGEPPTSVNASLGFIVGTYWCKGDPDAVFDLPVVAIGFDVPTPAPTPTDGEPTGSPSAASFEQVSAWSMSLASAAVVFVATMMT